MNTRARSDVVRGVAMVLLAAMFWGTTGTAQSLAPNALSAYWVGALRLAVASAFFAVVLGVLHRTGRVRFDFTSLPWRWFVGSGMCMAVYNLAFFAGVRATGVAVGTAVAIGSGPIWAGMLQALVSGRAPTAGWWFGSALAILGGTLMIFGKGTTLTLTASGVSLCLLAGLSYAAYALLNKHIVHEVPAPVATLGVFGVATVLAVPAAWLIAGSLVMTSQDWWIVGYLGVVATGVSYLLFTHALRHISGATGVTLALAEPVTAFVLAIVVVGEHPQALAFVGLALVLAGLGAVVLAELRASSQGELNQG